MDGTGDFVIITIRLFEYCSRRVNSIFPANRAIKRVTSLERKTIIVCNFARNEIFGRTRFSVNDSAISCSISNLTGFADGSADAFNSRPHDQRSATGQPADDVFEAVDAQRLVLVGETFNLEHLLNETDPRRTKPLYLCTF